MRFVEYYTDSQQAALLTLKKAGVALDIVSYFIEGEIADVYELSRCAAIESMTVMDRRIEENLKRIKEEQSLRIDPEKVFRLKVFPGVEPIGEEISMDDFIRPDIAKDLPELSEIDPYFEHKEAYEELLYAFFFPPYGLDLGMDEEYMGKDYTQEKCKAHTRLYHSFIYGLLNITFWNKESITIYRWSDDWSNYFDAGKEWWGTFFWTIYNRDTHTILVIGASNTD